MLKVSYLPAKVATKLTEASNVIGIRSPYDSPYEYATKHKRLLSLSFFNNCSSLSQSQRERMLSAEQAQQIIDFVETCKAAKEDIIVHCGEGRVRSPAVAMFIEFMTSDDLRDGEGSSAYMVSTDIPGTLNFTDHYDRDLFFRLREQLDTHRSKED